MKARAYFYGRGQSLAARGQPFPSRTYGLPGWAWRAMLKGFTDQRSTTLGRASPDAIWTMPDGRRFFVEMKTGATIPRVPK